MEDEWEPPNRRLPVFKSLEQGFPLCEDRSLPHIRENFIPRHDSGCPSQETCWKNLLEPDTQGVGNEWTQVREHFLNARSKNILSIVQRK